MPKLGIDALGFEVCPEAGTKLAVEFRTMDNIRRSCPLVVSEDAPDFDCSFPFIIVDATENYLDVELRLRLLLEALTLEDPGKRDLLVTW